MRATLARSRRLFSTVLGVLLAPFPAEGGDVQFREQPLARGRELTLSNPLVRYGITIVGDTLTGDRLSVQEEWADRNGTKPFAVVTNADFNAEIMWTDWSAPGKIHNADNLVTLSKGDWSVTSHEVVGEKEAGEIRIFFTGRGFPLRARLSVSLASDAFFVQRRLAFSDTTRGGHFLSVVAPLACTIPTGKITPVHAGGFGQPVALKSAAGGVFFGTEYPAAHNVLQVLPRAATVRCVHEVGETIGAEWLESESVVEGLTPDPRIKLWFMRYVDAIRAAPLRPYTLYNSWYDLRSPEYPGITPPHVMNEENVMRIIGLLRRNMITKHNIQLDAFVLDDGWDVYESDWVLRRAQFPRGLRPLSDELGKTGTHLGIWFGPTGGYSFRMKRINWMRSNGYEVVGATPHTAMLCVAGSNYRALLRKRVVDCVAQDGIRFFKWDGIQFSCSEKEHGHPVGLFSRRAVVESVIDLCRSVRAQSPDVFLNITSGTWLSPWWVRHANQIWMQGQDYGYADVPSISPRDAAITYRDFVLYDNFTRNGFWFPLANLMTHGIIKGKLQMLGGMEEPLDKFTTEVLLYFARGVSMWEMYISPDVLAEGEWDAMGKAMLWAKDRFPLLCTTEMVGGDPTQRQSYGYVHCSDSAAIIAARNPWIARTVLKIHLSPDYGLAADARHLVVEQVYPTRYIFPRLFAAGETLELPLEGYETALYEIYPFGQATEPLLAGMQFDAQRRGEREYVVSLYGPRQKVTVLNPELIDSRTPCVPQPGKDERPAAVVKGMNYEPSPAGGTIAFSLDQSVRDAMLALLLTPSAGTLGKIPPQVRVTVSGSEDTARYERGESKSVWYTTRLQPGSHRLQFRVVSPVPGPSWSGTVHAWLLFRQEQPRHEVTVVTRRLLSPRVMPPRPWPAGEVQRVIELGRSAVVAESRP